MRHSAKGLGVLAQLMLLLAGCSDGSGDGAKNNNNDDNEGVENDTATADDENSSDEDETTDDDSDGNGGFIDTDPDEVDDNQPPELPSPCSLVTEEIAGEDIGKFEVSSGGDGREPNIVFDTETGRSLIVWEYFRGNSDGESRWGIQSVPYHLEASEGTDSYVRSLGETVSITTADESDMAKGPAVALSDDGFMLVFRDARYDETCYPLENAGASCDADLVFMMLDTAGAPLDSEPVRITDRGDARKSPAIARLPDGGYIIAWNETRLTDSYVKAVKVDSDGIVGDIHTLHEAADDIEAPHVAVNDEVAVVVFATTRAASIVAKIWLHEDPEPLGRIDVLSEEHSSQRGPQIAAGRDGFLVAWTAELANQKEVFLRPLDASGDASGDTQRGTWSHRPIEGVSVAWNGETYAIAWESITDNGEEACAMPGENEDQDWCNEQIFAALVDEDGAVQSESVMYSHDPNPGRSVKLVWDGVGWTAVWEAWRQMRWQVFHGQMVCK